MTYMLNMTMADYKTSLQSLLYDSLVYESVQSAFHGYLVNDQSENIERITEFSNSFNNYWSSLTQEQQDDGLTINEFVEFANSQKRQSQVIYVYKLLKAIVNDGIIPARVACEAILSSDRLTLSNYVVWKESFNFISTLLPQMDYKSVRSVYSKLLTKVKSELPDSTMGSQTEQLRYAKEVVNLGLDREVSLLPSYLVINDIYKLYPASNFQPHWAFSKEFTVFVNTFKPLAQMVSITGLSSLVPVVGHCGSSNVWNLEPDTLKFPLKGPLPYSKNLVKPQKGLLRYVIAQTYSRDMVCDMLGLKKQQKQRCEALEELLVELIIIAMEKTENDESNHLLWQHLSSQLIFFILFQFASFPHMVLALHDKLSKRNLHKGRDKLMWVLLQFISGSIQKGPLSTFSPVMKLFSLLYPEKEPLQVPSHIEPECNISFAMACIWVHLSKKAKIDTVPVALKSQIEFLDTLLKQKIEDVKYTGFDLSLLCNAYSTIQESFQILLQKLLSRIYGAGQNNTKLGAKGILATTNTVPLEMKLLDSLTVHAKMSLIQGIVRRIMQIAQATQQQQQLIPLAPALVETYSRLLVYMEIELLGIKAFLSQLLPAVLKNKAWGILHTLAEMFSYRLHHIQPHYRAHLLNNLHSLLMVPFTEKRQIHLCVQHAAVRLILGFGNADIIQQLSSSRMLSDPKHPKQLLSKDCEELNRVLIITIARAMHITAANRLPSAWCEGVLKEAMQITPHRWSSTTLSHFPSTLQKFYSLSSLPKEESKTMLNEKVENHFRKIKGFSKDEEIISYCTETEELPELFLCILWKVLSEQNQITQTYYQILMKLRPKPISNYLNIFCDFIIQELKSFTGANQFQFQRTFTNLNDLIWKYDVIPVDRFLLSLVLRPLEDNEFRFAILLINYLLIQQQEFSSRVKHFVSENHAQHWNQSDWHEKHKQYHDKFPENYYYEGILAANNLHFPSQEYLPTYFGNVCLRFLPVFGIIIHWLLETQQNTNFLESLLKNYGCLFKFHDRPITYLYNTLHYYEEILTDHKRPIKKLLISVIMSSQTEAYPKEWATKEFLDYINDINGNWSPTPQYFMTLIGRFVNTIQNHGPSDFVSCDWRFNEFSNPSALAMYATCVELMTLPLSGEMVGKAIIDVVYRSSEASVENDILSWINATALILTSLPQSYLTTINQSVYDVLQNNLSNVILTTTNNIPTFFDFCSNREMNCASYQDYVLALFHATWLHASVGQFAQLYSFLKDNLKALIENEAQLLYVMCLYGPFLQRFQTENLQHRCFFEVCGEFYLMLGQVCRNPQPIIFTDAISDFFYHMKYMYVGDNLKATISQTIEHLHEPLQRKLKFMISPSATSTTVKQENFQRTQTSQHQKTTYQQHYHKQNTTFSSPIDLTY